MIDFSSVVSILFIQKPHILEKQRYQVRQLIKKALPQSELYFASCAEDVNSDLEVDIVITPTLEWLPHVLRRLKGYRWIHFLSAGVEKIWSMDFKKENILLTKSSGVNSVPMSEYALGAMLYFAKEFDCFNVQSHQKIWERAWLEELTGKTLLILGLGYVGQAVAAKANAFGMRVIGMQRNPKDNNNVELVVSPKNIAKFLPDADYIVVCLPLTSSTRKFVDIDFFNRVKPGSVLIDMSRGGVVDEKAVLSALEKGQLRGAALDVFEVQPLQAESKLWQRSNVLITPHVSGTTPHYLKRALGIFTDNVNSLIKNGELLTAVDIVECY